LINKLAIFISRQLQEVVSTRGKVLIPKFAPYVKCLKYLGKHVPLKQISALDNLLLFTRFLNENGIPYFLSGGTLLGAVRQGSFAGRPGDIDLGILEDDQIKLLKLLPLLEGLNFALEPMYSHFEDKIIFIKWRTPAVDVMVYRPLNGVSELSNMSYSHVNASAKKFICSIDLTELRMASIFGYKFPVPKNAEEFIANQYGESWRVPDAPQSMRHKRRFFNSQNRT
jgi:hypothetical protein